MEIKTHILTSSSIYNLTSSPYELLPALDSGYYYETSKINFIVRDVGVNYNFDNSLFIYAADIGPITYLSNGEINALADSFSGRDCPFRFSGNLTLVSTNAPTQGNSTLQLDVYYEKRSIANETPKITFTGEVVITGSANNPGRLTTDIPASFGFNTQAIGSASFAQGNLTTANGEYSHAEGNGTTANGVASHTEGAGTITGLLAQYAHAEGSITTANGFGSHAEGTGTLVSGSGAHSEGYFTNAYADYSHTEGKFTSTIRDVFYPTASLTSIVYPYNYQDRFALSVGGNINDYVLIEASDSKRIWLAAIDTIGSVNYDFGAHNTAYVSDVNNQLPLYNLSGSGNFYAVVVTSATTAYPYNKLDYSTKTIEVYDQDLSGIAEVRGAVFTVQNSGSYAYDIASISFTDSTSSIVLNQSQSFHIGGGKEHSNQNSPTLSGAYYNGTVLLTSVTGSEGWGAYVAGDFESPFTGSRYYSYRSQSFMLLGDRTNVFKPGTIYKYGSNFGYALSSTYDPGTLTTTVYNDTSFAGILPSSYIPESIVFGEASHAGGYYTTARGTYQTVVGHYNNDYNYTDLFVVGGGTLAQSKDVLTVSTTTVTVNSLLTLVPQHPLLLNAPTGSFAVSASSPPKPYFYNGTSWNALY